MPNCLTVIYPGSFDPPTNGHLDLIARGSRLAEHLIVAVLENTQKNPLFTVNERLEMLKEIAAPFPNVEIDSFSGLLVDYVTHRKADCVLRGLRSVSDFESETQMTLLNHRMRPEMETIFVMASAKHSFLSSRMVKEIIALKGDPSPFLPPAVMRRLLAR
jgi:pantetheine-phosphate adenylyltransferase